MPSLYMNFQIDSACHVHRLLYPSRFVGPLFEKAGCPITLGPSVAEGHDWFCFSGLPNEMGIIEIARQKREGVKFLWSLDDDFPSIPDWSPAKQTAKGLGIHDLTRKMADLILVSTPALAATFDRPGDPPVLVAPNLIDVAQFPEPAPLHVDETGRSSRAFEVKLPIKVVWAGSHTHTGDVEPLVPVIDHLIRQFGPDRVRFIFVGQQPPSQLMRDHLYKGVMHQPMVPYPAYQSVINSIKPDIYLAPLAEIPFNLSKSDIRILEGWALGAAVVATPWGEYTCVRSGVDGRLCDTLDSWYSALARLIVDHDERLKLAVAGRERVEREFNWNVAACRLPWVKALARVFGVDEPEDRDAVQEGR